MGGGRGTESETAKFDAKLTACFFIINDIIMLLLFFVNLCPFSKQMCGVYYIYKLID